MTITHVMRQQSGWWLVTDSRGDVHATKDDTLARFAERCHDKETSVAILSVRGWHYRDLRKITEITQKEMCG